MGGIILTTTSLIAGMVTVIVVVIVLGCDSTCKFLLCKIDPEYRHNIKSGIPGYSIYKYLKWKKELKNKDEIG